MTALSNYCVWQTLECESPVELLKSSPDVAALNRLNITGGIPAAAFPPSLIKWPGLNNNKQKRLSEIKKQVSSTNSFLILSVNCAPRGNSFRYIFSFTLSKI